ncbi:hypothetical protein HP439_02585 [Sphingobacterium shayense]|uniref:hypothetical protein n=1 Tax=Sphingobacterium shayense TaxID=626343 RepID=UPI00155647D8|nr:hypothetical protein [Sphingobacterium shayense]NQD69607.1 hypothetical protein [Sphingobacterium shayense]
MNVIPQNFDDWKICIEQKCGIPLTLEFARARLAVYENESLAETQRFINLYSYQHLKHIKGWFLQIISAEEAIKTI